MLDAAALGAILATIGLSPLADGLPGRRSIVIIGISLLAVAIIGWGLAETTGPEFPLGGFSLSFDWTWLE